MHDLIITTKEIDDRIKEVLAYAEAHPTTEEELKEIMAGTRAPAGDHGPHVVHIPPFMKVVYSEEYQPRGLYKHFSISDSHKELPGMIAINYILTMFGFKNIIAKDSAHNMNENFIVWLDEKYGAINVLEKKII